MTACSMSAAKTDAPSGATVEAGASDDDIKVTAAMTEAGVLRLFDYDPAFSNEKDVVVEIFKAMCMARHFSASGGSGDSLLPGSGIVQKM
jgi:hypothetical protein